MAPEGSESLPLVVFIHGFMGDKSQGMQLGYLLARSGIFFAALDARFHGDRSVGSGRMHTDPAGLIDPKTSPVDAVHQMFQIIQGTALDVEAVIDRLRANPRVNPSRVGVSGFSMGGFTAFLVASRYPHIRAAVPIAAAPSFSSFWLRLLKQCRSEDSPARDKERSLRTEFIRRLDPKDFLQELDSFPLLMLHGRHDKEIPPSYAETLYRKLRPRYEDRPERLDLRLYDTDHRFSTAMARDACEWFRRFL